MAQIADGSSNTFLCGEKYIDSNHYLDGLDAGDSTCCYCGYSEDTVRCVVQNAAALTSQVNAAWIATQSAYKPRQDNPGYTDNDSFGSAHAGMFNMAFCDGSVHQISYGISPTVYIELGARNDGAAIDASMY